MIYLYNTLTRKKEEFVPLKKGEVKMYTCGLTVNNYAHIGHGVAYILMDLLKKMFKANGYNVLNVMNITDVGHLTSDEDEGDDKVALAAKREGKDPYAIADYYTKYFLGFIDRLNIATSNVICKATDHITDMMEFVRGLIKKGYAYSIEGDGIYFDVSKFKTYGRLSRKNLEAQKAGARIEVNTKKRSPHDFAVWKYVEENTLMKWPNDIFSSVAGCPNWGTPGWHIECSAMAHKYLGDRFDVHTGGADHIPIHHENEIAQDEAYYGHKTVNYWMHCGFLKVDGVKMSKSLNNFHTLETLAKHGYSPLDFRYFALNASYRKPMNFTFEALSGAKTTLKRLYEIASEHKNGKAKTPAAKLKSLKQNFIKTISDDLNIAKALGDVWTALKQQPKSPDIYNFLLECDDVLSLDIEQNVLVLEKQGPKQNIPQGIINLANERLEAKKAKNFTLADSIRTQIENAGYKVADTPDGFEVTEA